MSPPAASTPVPSSSTPAAVLDASEPVPDRPAAAADTGGLSETPAAPPAGRESDQPPSAPAPSAADDSGPPPSVGIAQPDAAAPLPDMPRVPTQEAPPAAADGAQAARTPLPATGSGSTSTAAPLLPQAALELLIRRGDQMFRLGDVSGARLLYGRAAASGSSMAAVSMGRTFDPVFLAGIGAGISPDAAAAAEWYRRATALGSTEAVALLQRVEGRGPRQQ